MTAAELADLLLSHYGQPVFDHLVAQFRSQLTLEVLERLKERADAEMRNNANAALQIAKVALVVAEHVGTLKAEALTLWIRGNAFLYLSRYREALTCYQDAETALRQAQEAILRQAQGMVDGKQDLRLSLARLQINQMAALQEMGANQKALELAQRARATCEILGKPAYRYLAGLEMNIGALYHQLGDLRAAMAAYERGRTMAIALQNNSLMARLDINRANLLEEMDRFASAERLLLDSRASLEKAGLQQETARADLNLGRLAYRRGQYLAALRYLEAAGTNFAAIPNPVDVAVVNLRRSFVYRDLNLLQETITLAAEAEQVFMRYTLPWYRALALINQGRGYQSLGNYARAKQLLDKARRILHQQGALTRVLLLDVDRAHLALTTGRHHTARRIARRVKKQLDRSTWPALIARLDLLLARCALAAAPPDLSSAHQYVEAALAPAREYKLMEIVTDAYHLLGQLAEIDEDLTLAWQHYQTAIEAIEKLRVGLPWDEFQLGFMDDKLPIYRDGLRLGERTASPVQILYLLNLAHSAPLPSLHLPSASLPGDLLNSRLRKLRETWHWYQSQQETAVRLDSESEAGHAPVTDTVLRERLGELEAEIAELTRRWQLRATPSEPTESLTSDLVFPHEAGSPEEFLAQIQQQLHPRDVLLHYYRVEGQVHALLVTSDSLKLVADLSPVESVDRLLRSWRFNLEHFTTLHTAPETSLKVATAHLTRLHQALMAPLETHLNEQHRLFLVLPPDWHDLPLSACFDGQSYLAERLTLSYLSTSQAMRQTPPPPVSTGRETQVDALVLGYSDGGQLPHTIAEARRVAEILPSPFSPTLRLEDEGTLACLLRVSRTSRLLHLATHAVFRPDNPFFSWMRLADARLTVAELYEMTLPQHPLVVLSACETGRGKSRGGGLLGMGRGLLAAGASGLVVSLWKVADEATVQLMADFYAHLGLAYDADSVAYALRQAQQAAIAREQHPFCWAGFIFIRG